MREGSAISNTLLFVTYAGNSIDKWKKAIGQQVTHIRYGKGVILEVDKGLVIQFKKEARRFQWVALSNKSYFSDITLPNNLDGIEIIRDNLAEVERRKAEEKRRRQEIEAQQKAEAERLRIEAEQQIEEQRRQRLLEAEARREFAALKSKYLAEKHPDSSPSSRLYIILLKIDSGEPLTEVDIKWLEEKHIFSCIAIFYEKEFNNSGNLWDLIKASKYWRDASKPHYALKLTEKCNTTDTKLIAALLTTRGGAFRDINELNAAEKCALEALKYSQNSYHPYNLLGAIEYQAGNPKKGDEYFAIAQQLGAKVNTQDSFVRSAIEKAGQNERRTVAEYLLKKDSQRYKWAEYYLKAKVAELDYEAF
ncbi:hypothetical protein NIES4073_18900 [Kalymmatonema gypsitolerans NIES-4073]|nr:hypothetical protein NIES4073_18900 [Scytonema sp. NIES-4073]